ncbi:hypothetical protein MTYM_02142 [Methylococcales bacterium]|nr:hypothetical protein MTYM_02142 [Methylococcales bacterium]
MKPKLLANENFPAPSVAVLREAGFDVFYIAESSVARMEPAECGVFVAASPRITQLTGKFVG